MNAQAMKERIQTLSKDTQCEMVDLTGTQDHWQAVIISSAFTGKVMMEQHRMIYQLFDKEIHSNEVHALTLKTYTHDQYEKFKNK